MFEILFNPKKAKRRPWEMLLIGILYASLSILITYWFFLEDFVLSKFSGMLVVTFCVMFTLPFIYFVIKQEEREDETVTGFLRIWDMHKDALYAFMWLFLGFIIAFSFWNIILINHNLLNAQVETYCSINSPENIEECFLKHTESEKDYTGSVTKGERFFAIMVNNIFVIIFTLLFSLIFGAGAIFILAWNASVIAVAIGIFTKNSLIGIPLGIARYMIHGIPEIAAYFLTALAGGMFGFGILKNGITSQKTKKILENVMILIFFSIILLVIGALIEVYLTPLLF